MPDDFRNEFVVYKSRWYVLFVVSALNITNAALWISFSSAVNDAMVFYDVSEASVNWLSLVYFIGTLILGFPAIHMIDSLGLRNGILIGAWLNGLGAAVRSVGSSELVATEYKFYVTLGGQILAAIAQPFIIFIPTKVAEVWFPTDQRALATGIAAIANPIGQVLGCGLTPVIVKHCSDMKMMNIIWCIPSALCTILATIGIRSSKPPSPPAASAAICNYAPMMVQLKELVKNGPFWLLLLSISSGVGLFGSLLSCMQEILCPHGFSNIVSSISSVLFVGCGLVGGIAASIWVGKNNKFTEIMKPTIGLMLIAFCAFVITSRYENLKYAMLVASGITGLMGFAAYPVALELGIECTYPIVSEATSTGVLMIAGQLVGILFMVFFETLGQTPSLSDLRRETCSKTIAKMPFLGAENVMQPQDLTVPMLATAGVVVACCSVFVLFFDTQYKRLQAEEKAKLGQILGVDQDVADGSSRYTIYS